MRYPSGARRTDEITVPKGTATARNAHGMSDKKNETLVFPFGKKWARHTNPSTVTSMPHNMGDTKNIFSKKTRNTLQDAQTAIPKAKMKKDLFAALLGFFINTQKPIQRLVKARTI
jgi:hypothetical protein